MKGTKEFYDKTAIEWADKWYEDETLLPCLKQFISKFNSNPRILDLCCGAGYESMRMSNLGASVVGIDFSEASIQIAKNKNKQIDFYVDDMLNDYSYIGKVDGIAVIAGLIHICNNDLKKVFKRMDMVLNNNGYVLLVIREGKGKQNKQSYVNIENIEYDRNVIAHTLDELISYSKEIFEYEEEILADANDVWKRYLFKKTMK